MKVKQNTVYSIFLEFVSAVFLTAIVMFCTTAASCKVNPEGIDIVEGDYSLPEITGVEVNPENQIELSFSKPVTFETISLTDETAEASLPLENGGETQTEGGFKYSFIPGEEMLCTSSYVLFAVVADENGNSLSFSTDISGYNNNVPDLKINEIRNRYSKPKLEYIEFLSTTSGNTAGMTAEIIYKDNITYYTFPALEVSENQYILLHLRTKDETCIDEVTDFSSSTYSDAVPDVCDLWIPSDTKIMGDSGIIILRDRDYGEIIDGFVFGEAESDFQFPLLQEKYQELVNSSLWPATENGISFFNSTDATVTRTMSRQFTGSDSSPSDWIIVKNSGCTPGALNSTEKYEQ